jgi:hypothetical protein
MLLLRVNYEWLAGESWGILTEFVIVKPSLLWAFLLGINVLFWSFIFEFFFLSLCCLGMVEFFLYLDVFVLVEFLDRFLSFGFMALCR